MSGYFILEILLNAIIICGITVLGILLILTIYTLLASKKRAKAILKYNFDAKKNSKGWHKMCFSLENGKNKTYIAPSRIYNKYREGEGILVYKGFIFNDFE